MLTPCSQNSYFYLMNLLKLVKLVQISLDFKV